MNGLNIDDRVVLKSDVPELGLRRGATGDIKSVWRTPGVTLEIEFAQPESEFGLRALLPHSVVEPQLR